MIVVTYRPLKIRVEEYRKAVSPRHFDKPGMVDHVQKNGNHLHLGEEVKIIDREHQREIRKLK